MFKKIGENSYQLCWMFRKALMIVTVARKGTKRRRSPGWHGISGHCQRDFTILAGDQFIRLVSGLLSKVFQRQTDIIGRFGGEELVILLLDKYPSKARAMAESFRSEVANSVLRIKDEEIRSTVSLGLISCLPRADLSTTEIIEAADRLLYAAKSGGRNRLVVSSLGASIYRLI